MKPQRKLSCFDAVCIIVGIIVGAGIYETAPTVAGCMGSTAGILIIWLIGGLLAITGALCYAELATTYPHQGGDYVYFNRAYGPWAGFLFGWSQLAIIRPGDIALMAFIFARYMQALYAPFEKANLLYAAVAVLALTGINMLGVREGKWTQNILTVLKIAGLLFIVIAGFCAPEPPGIVAETSTLSFDGVKLALILVMFTYGGWNEMAYVSAEVIKPNRNIIRALLLGTGVVILFYLLINGAYLAALGSQGMAQSQAVAVDTLMTVLPDLATRTVNVLICISTLGAVNGLIFTGARISYAMGKDHRPFRRLGHWSQRFGTPVWALLAQGGISMLIILFAGSFIDTILYTAPIVWLFFLGTAISVFVLRIRDKAMPRPYKIANYPAIPLTFCTACAFMLYNSVTYALGQKPIGFVIVCGVLGLGGGVYLFTTRNQKSS